MEWECACGISNSTTSNECAGCGWSREYGERYKRGEIKELTAEESELLNKKTLKKELLFILFLLIIDVAIFIFTIIWAYVYEIGFESGLFDVVLLIGIFCIFVFLFCLFAAGENLKSLFSFYLNKLL